MNKIFIISFVLATGAVAFITYQIVHGMRIGLFYPVDFQALNKQNG